MSTKPKPCCAEKDSIIRDLEERLAVEKAKNLQKDERIKEILASSKVESSSAYKPKTVGLKQSRLVMGRK